MIALALLLVAAPAAPADPVEVYAGCLIAQAKRLDDRRSDATTIAQIVRIECRPQERAAAFALSGDGIAENREAVVLQIEAGGLSRAVRAVLRVRTAGAE